jgi:hypothetical protein
MQSAMVDFNENLFYFGMLSIGTKWEEQENPEAILKKSRNHGLNFTRS